MFAQDEYLANVMLPQCTIHIVCQYTTILTSILADVIINRKCDLHVAISFSGKCELAINYVANFVSLFLRENQLVVIKCTD